MISKSKLAEGTMCTSFVYARAYLIGQKLLVRVSMLVVRNMKLERRTDMKRSLLLILILASLIPVGYFVHVATDARQNTPPTFQALSTAGTWNTHNYDLIYTMAFSSAQQPDGPLVVYRASGSDLRTSEAVIAVARPSQGGTPLFFPSPNGQYLALLTPLRSGYGTDLNGAALRLLSTDGSVNTLLVPGGVAAGDQVIWAADSSALYYHSGIQEHSFNAVMTKSTVDTTQYLTPTRGVTTSRGPSPICSDLPCGGQVGCTSVCNDYDEIHRVDLYGRDTTLLHRLQDGSSLRLIGIDSTGSLIVTEARQGHPVELLRLGTDATHHVLHLGMQSTANISLVTTLPPDILPGNVLGLGSDGASVECEHVLSWSPLRYSIVRIGFVSGTITEVPSLFATAHFGRALTPLNRSGDGQVLVMSQVTALRADLAAQGITNVPAQENLLVADATSGATERLALPASGQIVQTFWAAHIPTARLQAVSPATISGLLNWPRRFAGTSEQNASVLQQDEWMLEAHANRLFNAPPLSTMCYGNCTHGAVGTPHVSAAILHGMAYVESNWHQFNTMDYQVNGEAIGTPIKSWDGGWGEFQQTWAMPPQCQAINNCRSDATKIQQEQSYNIGTGVQSLITAWNGTAGVASSTDPNDPYKANDWFFAVWAYNGAYGNNPNDVPSSVYGHWYPGAPFRSIYEEYVWYFAAHPQNATSGWTDDYLPGLGTSLLPPQSAFTNTSDSFVACVTCTIPDWTSGSFDREWVGMGAPNATVAGYFQALFAQSGGENVVGLPRDNGGSAAMHRWGAGWTQDFGGGSYLPGAFMLADGSTTPYWVYGGVWTQYLVSDHGVGGCHGYPTSALVPFSDPALGPHTYLRQAFQTGYIVWDATTPSIAVDMCR